MIPQSQAGSRLKPVLTSALFRAALRAAIEKSSATSAPVSIAIVDEGGHLLALDRPETIHAGTVEVSIAKARSAAMFRRPTKIFSDKLAEGALALMALPGVLAAEGGVPLHMDGHFCGAIGVSGSAPEVDQEIAEAGANALLQERSAR